MLISLTTTRKIFRTISLIYRTVQGYIIFSFFLSTPCKCIKEKMYFCESFFAKNNTYFNGNTPLMHICNPCLVCKTNDLNNLLYRATHRLQIGASGSPLPKVLSNVRETSNFEIVLRKFTP